MKLAMPVNEKDMKTEICVSFGRSPYFLFYDTDTEEGTFIDNSAAASSGGAGIKAAQIIVDNNAGALLTPRCGENAANVLKSADINLYKTEGVSVTENIEAFIDGKLSLLDEIHEGFHGHGGN
ncbi:MAG: NifB/NifX family molybdenum-iron cluster-binding protein [Anaerovoracaceae bacterium]